MVKRWFSCKTVEQMSQVLFVRFFTSRGKNEQITKQKFTLIVLRCNADCNCYKIIVKI